MLHHKIVTQFPAHHLEIILFSSSETPDMQLKLNLRELKGFLITHNPTCLVLHSVLLGTTIPLLHSHHSIVSSHKQHLCKYIQEKGFHYSRVQGFFPCCFSYSMSAKSLIELSFHKPQKTAERIRYVVFMLPLNFHSM